MSPLSFYLPLSFVTRASGFSDLYRDLLLGNIVDMDDTVGISPGIFWGVMHWNVSLLSIGKGYHLVEQGFIIPRDVGTLSLPSPGKLSFTVCLC